MNIIYHWAQLFLQCAQLFLQLIGIVALIVTVIIYSGQLRAMNSQLQTSLQQLDATRQGSNGQNILALANFLQAQDVRDARTKVFQILAKKAFNDWNAEEKLLGAKVCSSYGVAGVILMTGVIPGDPFFENWGSSIYRSFNILLPYIREMQKPENAGPHYWSTYEWLYQQVKEKYPYLTIIQTAQSKNNI